MPEPRPGEADDTAGDTADDTVAAGAPSQGWTEQTADVDLGTGPEPTTEPADAATRAGTEPTTDKVTTDKPTTDTEPGTAETQTAPKPSRPAGKRRTAGTARPEDLSAAEAEAALAPLPTSTTPRRRANRLAVAGVLALVAVVLVGLAVWFRGEANALASGDANTALTDPATTSEVIGQLTSAVEDTFSYNYTDLASTERAVDAVLTGKARCEYDQLFGQVQELAPKQKIIMATAVRSIALVRLDGDRAEALVFIDQSSTRVDTNKSVAGEAQFGVLAHREDNRWKITEFNMFDQQLLTGQPAPKC
ncbi:hypothetical protein [Actinophytocola xanthii]|nr:hypothetical protein [Actinophytocola xanthii]